jgi:two-component system, LuxR family, sensor kinase FixL
MAIAQVFALPAPAIGAAYLLAYVALDWLSFIHPFAPYGITPWNPSTGLSFVLVLLFGRRFIAYLFAAPLLADILVRHLPFSLPVQIVTAVVIGGGYVLAVACLMRPKLHFHPALQSLRDLVLLLTTATVSTAAVAVSYCMVLALAGLLGPADLPRAAMRFWVGDAIGVAVVAPFTLLLMTRTHLLPLSRETAVQFVAIVASLWFVFGYAERHHFQLFYLLFLPVVWVAVRSGLEGVAPALLMTQLGVILGVQFLPAEEIDLTSFQALMLVLTLTGLAAGALVTERRRAEFQLRLHQESLSRLSRLGSLGELAAMVAHEINQPLTAAGTYARLVADALQSDTNSHEDRQVAIEGSAKAVAQLERAADVVRHLRALIRLDQTGRAPITVERLLQETIELCQPELHRHQVVVRTRLQPGLPAVMVDLLQIEQVLINLLRNAVEAIAASGRSDGTIVVEAKHIDDGMVELRVVDSGPGFPSEWNENTPPLLASRKPEGLGIGLSLCRSIVESHGGRFELGGDAGGAVVSFTLPSVKVEYA